MGLTLALVKSGGRLMTSSRRSGRPRILLDPDTRLQIPPPLLCESYDRTHENTWTIYIGGQSLGDTCRIARNARQLTIQEACSYVCCLGPEDGQGSGSARHVKTRRPLHGIRPKASKFLFRHCRVLQNPYAWVQIPPSPLVNARQQQATRGDKASRTDHSIRGRGSLRFVPSCAAPVRGTSKRDW